MPEQPAVDAQQVERVAAHRQAPRALAGLKLLHAEGEMSQQSILVLVISKHKQ